MLTTPNRNSRRTHVLIGAGLALCSGPAIGDSDGNTLRGYTGGSLSGYTGGALSGYTGGSLRGYTGGSLRGYTGGSIVRGSRGTGIAGFSAAAQARHEPSRCFAFGEGFVRAAMGPVEAVVVGDGTVTFQVLGQMFEVPADDAVAKGDYVVAAQLDAEATGIVYPVGVPYVPGVSLVRIKASASRVDLGTGQATLGATHVDYTTLLSTSPGFAPQANAVLAFVGIQPAPGGVIIAGPDPNAAVGCSVLDGRL